MITFMFYVSLLTPLLTALTAFSCRTGNEKQDPSLINKVNLAGISILLVSSLCAAFGVSTQGGEHMFIGMWFHLDALGALFLGILGVIGFTTGLYSVGYMNQEVQHGEVTIASLSNYYGFFHLFIFTMMLAITTNNLIVMWVAIEATTLSSAFLVGFYGQRSSLEAGWKYVVICTVGVAFGLYGTVLVYSGASNIIDPGAAAFWTEVVKQPGRMDSVLMHIAFVFILIGFGTKAGLFPMHAWLPDAHSEAPSPVSALLSAALLNCALLVIIRYYIIITGSIGDEFPKMVLLIFGFMSVTVAAFLILAQQDVKRLLAYSSVENMGLIAIALGIGGPLGIAAALLHALNHSLVKAMLFCSSGNILLKYGTRDMSTVKGLLTITPLTAVLFVGGTLALGGMPPFNVFVSEFMMVNAGISAGHWFLVILLLLLLTLVLAGLIRMIAKTVMGKPPAEVSKGELGPLTIAPMCILVVLMLVMGVCIPQPVKNIIENASNIVSQEKVQPLQVENAVDMQGISMGFAPYFLREQSASVQQMPISSNVTRINSSSQEM